MTDFLDKSAAHPGDCLLLDEEEQEVKTLEGQLHGTLHLCGALI